MRRAGLLTAAGCLLIPPILVAQSTPPDAGVQVQQGDRFAAAARYREAIDAYRKALSAAASDEPLGRRARAGLALALLRTGDFSGARTEAEQVATAAGADASALALFGETLWASGLFDEAEETFDRALRENPAEPRAHQGRARTLAARSRLDDALEEALEAVRLDPSQREYHYTAGVIYERQRRYADAAAAYRRYVDLVPDRDHSETAAWTRAEIKFLDAFRGRTPIEFADRAEGPWTVPIRIARDKVFVAVGVNGLRPSEFVLDTGAELTVISGELARRDGIEPVAYVQSAGVGEGGMRPLQAARLDSLEIGGMKVRNVPALVKTPPLGGLPSREPDSFSPLALGLSMRVDYARKQLVLAHALPASRYETELPLRLYRLAMVRGTVNGRPASFIVDTGGEVISISRSTAGQAADPSAYRRIPVKVYGSSGWDRTAFLMPGVDLAFSSLRFPQIPVVVLDLKAPSNLLGFQLGGIVGHRFLSKYRVSIDLVRSVMGLDAAE